MVDDGDGSVGALSLSRRQQRQSTLRACVGLGYFLKNVVLVEWQDIPWASLNLTQKTVLSWTQTVRAYAFWNEGCISALESNRKGRAMLKKYGAHQPVGSWVEDRDAADMKALTPNAMDYSTGTPYAEDSLSAHKAAVFFCTAYEIMKPEDRFLSLRWGTTKLGEQEIPHQISNFCHTKLSMRCGSTDPRLLDLNRVHRPDLKRVHWLELCKVQWLVWQARCLLCRGHRADALALLQAAVSNGAHVPRLQARTIEVTSSGPGIDAVPTSIKTLIANIKPVTRAMVKGEDPLQNLTFAQIRQQMKFVADRAKSPPVVDT